MFDFQVLSNVNLSSTCNAFFDGSSINFYLSGGGCPNSAYSTVVWHEEGHWANVLFGSGNGSDGFGEGAADIWAMYIADDPVVAAEFFGPGQPIRTGENTNPFCGDTNPGCYGQVHADGEPLMGAVWKVRKRLKQTLGSATGGAVADLLMLSWFQVYDDGQIKSIIEEHWLVLDDDDGNIDNGTPHFPQIDGGFTDQGFPGFDLPLFSLAHTAITSVNNEDPVTINVDVTEENGVLDAVTLYYSFNQGLNFQPTPMSFVSGDTWTGQIPGVTSPAVMSYYIEATDSIGNGNSLPKKAPAEFFSYDVGVLTVHLLYDFEPAGDEGWTHQQLATQDDWQHGIQNGSSGFDPSAAFSGTRLWGNDLGPSGWNGNYQPNVNNQLLSPSFDLTGKTDTRLRFRRWLTVEKGIFDQAEIFVNGTRVFVNPDDVDLIDTAWTQMDIDISSLADNNPAVQVIFEMTSDGGVEFGGWNLDDFSVISLGPVSGDLFTEYGAGTAGTGGLAPHLTGSGSPVPGGGITLMVDDARSNASGTLFIGTTQAAVPALGGTFLVGNIGLQIPIGTDGAGSWTLNGNLPANPALSGTTLTQQYWCVDPLGPAGFAGSNGLEYTIQ
jgi:hypothetical protein